jgi:hypothetical protein
MNTIYLNPFYFPHLNLDKIKLLLLLSNKMILYADTLKQSLRQEEDFSKLVNWGYIGLVTSQEYADGYTKTSEILTYKEDLMEKDVFWRVYNECVKYDQNVPYFKKIVGDLTNTYLHAKLEELADEYSFMINWDVIVSKATKSVIVTKKSDIKLWEYKLSQLHQKLSIDRGITIKKGGILEFFLQGVTLRVPMKISATEVYDIRSDVRFKKFSEWFNKLTDTKNILDISISDSGIQIIKQYQELLDEINRNKKRLEYVFDIGAGIGSAIISSNPLVGIATSIVSEPAFSRLSDMLSKKYGSSNWIFMFEDLNK